MPGQIPLTTKYYPSDFNVTTMFVSDAEPGNASHALPVLYFDRAAVIDSITIWFEGTTSNRNVRFVQVTDSAIPQQATPIGTQSNVTENKAITTAETNTRWVSGTTSGFTISSTNNIVPQGATLWVTASASLSNLNSMQIQVRWRSQL
jgi:hypothetical protein